MAFLRHAVCALLLAGAASAQSVLVVDGAGGQPFTTISSAVTAADPGDVVLVRSGHYDEFALINKGLSLMADAGAVVTLKSLGIQGVPAGQTVRLRGITITEGSGDSMGTLRVLDCAGSVWVEECTILSAPIAFHSGGVRVSNSSAVVITNSVIAAPDLSLMSMVQGLHTSNSSVWMFDSEVTGRAGPDGTFPFGLAVDGSTGVSVSGGFLALAGTTVRGGKGGAGLASPFCTPGADGGLGLVVATGAIVHVADSSIEGGAGGSANGGRGCEAGSPGAASIVSSGAIVESSPEAFVRGLTTNSPVREGETLTVSLTNLAAAPGDFAWIMFSTSPTVAPGNPNKTLTALLALHAPLLIDLGPLPGTATLDLSITVPDLIPGLDLAQVEIQGLVFDASASAFVPTAPSSVTLLDASF